MLNSVAIPRSLLCPPNLTQGTYSSTARLHTWHRWGELVSHAPRSEHPHVGGGFSVEGIVEAPYTGVPRMGGIEKLSTDLGGVEITKVIELTQSWRYGALLI